MNFLTHFKSSLALLIFLALLSLNVHAGLAGHVILAKGNVSAVSETGELRPLKRRSKIMSGDVIKTGTNSSVQIRFVDKALMTIKANSQMNITEYQLENSNAGDKEKAFMTLVKGGFRTISGKIGKGDKSAYKVDTPAASIGIRGTNYEVQQELNGDFVMAVYSGGISVQNESGSIELGLGSDFNFTRVTPNAAPKGLLIAPETLTENTATDEPAEEESDTAETNADGEEKSDSEATEETNDDSANETTDEGEATETAATEADGTDDNPPADEQTQETVASKGAGDASQSVAVEVADALDEKLAVTIKENKEQFEEKIIEELEDQGYLTEGETLADLDSTVLENLEKLGSLDKLKDEIDTNLNEADAIEDPVATTPDTNTPDPSTPSTTTPDTTTPDTTTPIPDDSFIQRLYANLTPVNNPYPETFNQNGTTYDIITDEQYNLVASDKLGVLVMPMNFNQDADGDLSFDFGQASVSSPSPVPDSVFATPLAASTSRINFSYTLLNTSDNSRDEYHVEVPITVAIASADDLLNAINDQLTSGNINVSVNNNPIHSEQDPGTFPIHDLVVTLTTPASGFSEFQINSGAAAGSFMTELDVHFSSNTDPNIDPNTDPNTNQEINILAEMMGGGNDKDNWHSEADIELFVMSGAWEDSTTGDGHPVMVMNETRTETHQDQNGVSNTFTKTSNEVIKPYGDGVITNNLIAFAACGNGGNICSIQVLKDDENIRWGAWLTEPGKGIQLYEKSEDQDGTTMANVHQEDGILAFWLAAERADINSLNGTAQFSTNDLNCTDFSQCIGFADDGVVQKMSGQFDVDFGSGLIDQGNLNIEVSNDASLALGIQGSATSTWNVNFSGHMEAGQPEFSTHTLNGTVVNEAGAQVSNQVIGNIGGIFVKPGDIFAGGYNLGTADGTNKHASGVFTLDK